MVDKSGGRRAGKARGWRYSSAAGDGSDNQEGLATFDDGGGKGRVGRLEGDVFFAGEEAQEGTARVGVVFADGAGQHGIAGFERVENGGDGDGWWNGKGEFAVDACEGAQVVWDLDANWLSGHGVRFKDDRGSWGFARSHGVFVMEAGQEADPSTRLPRKC
jgi:hypothetical protein